MTVIVMIALVLGCARKPAQIAFPERAGDWIKTGETRTYTADNLYEYIDGGAEKYVQAGVKQALTADYRYQNRVDAVADVFIMGDSRGAKAVFDDALDARCLPARLGETSCEYPGDTVKFRKGVYFVQVVPFHPTIHADVIALGKAIEAKLP